MVGKLKGLMAFVAGLSLFSLPVSAQNRPTGPDQELVGQLRQLGQDEIVIAKLAQDRATSPRVTAFALTLQRDHDIANGKLEAYAARKNMNLASIARPGDAMAHGPLANAPLVNSPRDEFDYKFVSRTVTDHQAAIDAAAAAQRLARDPELKGLIGGLLVVMSDHQTAGQQLLLQIPAPPARVVNLPAYPPGVSRTQTGADIPPPEALERRAP